MSKLIDEVAAAIARRVYNHPPEDRTRVQGISRAVLNEMFEEREVGYLTKPHGIMEKWLPWADLICDDRPPCAERQTILVPRAKPQPTLAEAAKHLVDALVPQMLLGECAIIGATEVNAARCEVQDALAREEGKP